MGWLAGWSYRKAVTLSRATGAVAGYQMKLLVGESAGAVGEDVDCNGHVLSTFDDLRFTTADGETLLDYWIESITGVSPNQLATVWIEFDSIGTGATTFYMYYGKAGAPAVSSGANTFILYDDFERGNDGDAVGGIWTTSPVGSIVISTEQKFGGTRSAKFKGDTGGNYPNLYCNQVASDNIAIMFRCYKEDAALVGWGQGNGTNRLAIRYDTAENILYYAAPSYVDTGSNVTPDVWQLGEVSDFVWATPTVDIYHNGVKIIDNAAFLYLTATYANQIWFSGFSNNTNVDFWIDNVIVRNYRTIEPAWGAWGDEESEAPPSGDTGAFFQLF